MRVSLEEARPGGLVQPSSPGQLSSKWGCLPALPSLSAPRPRKDMPHRCSAHFDAVAQIRGEAFFFKGNPHGVQRPVDGRPGPPWAPDRPPAAPPLCPPGKYFWRLTRDRHLVSLQPAQVHRFWRGLQRGRRVRAHQGPQDRLLQRWAGPSPGACQASLTEGPQPSLSRTSKLASAQEHWSCGSRAQGREQLIILCTQPICIY